MIAHSIELFCSDEFSGWNHLCNVVAGTADIRAAVLEAANLHISEDYNPHKLYNVDSFTVTEQPNMRGTWIITCENESESWDLDVQVVVKVWKL